MAYIKIAPRRGLRGLGALTVYEYSDLIKAMENGPPPSRAAVNSLSDRLREVGSWADYGPYSRETITSRLAVQMNRATAAPAPAPASPPTPASTTTTGGRYVSPADAYNQQIAARLAEAKAAEEARQRAVQAQTYGSKIKGSTAAPTSGNVQFDRAKAAALSASVKEGLKARKDEEGGSFWESLTEVLGIGAGVAKGVVESEAQRRAERDRVRAERRASVMTPAASMAPADMGGVVKLAAGVAVVGVAIWGVSKLLGGGRAA